MTQNDKLRNRLRVLKHEKNMNQENMAQLVGKSGSWYSKVEEGVIKLDLDQIEEFAKALSVEVAYLLEINNATYNSNNGPGYFNAAHSMGPVNNGSADRIVVESLIGKIEANEKELREMKEEMEKLKGGNS